MNAELEGKVYPEVELVVDPERVHAFRSAVGQSEGMPPTFATVAEFATFPQVVGDPELGLDLRRMLHGSQAYTLHRPLVEGETLRVQTRLDSIRSKGGNGFLTIVTELIGSDGAIACTAVSTMIERPP